MSSGHWTLFWTFETKIQTIIIYYCKLKKLKNLCHFIRACCVLHNLSDIDPDIFLAEDIVAEDNVIEAGAEVIEENGREVRNAICQKLFGLL